jgi:hypothetical protein
VDAPKGLRRGTRRRELIAHTLSRWRAGDRALREAAPAELRRGYEHAIQVAMRNLPRDSSMAELSTSYWQSGGTVDEYVRLPCPCGGVDRAVDPAVVRGVVFWRRLRFLLRTRRQPGARP